MDGLELAMKVAREGARTILMASSLEVADAAGRCAGMAEEKVACALLRKLNHRVTVVSNGALAFEQIRNSNFDLVLMDVQMPVMDGLSAAAAIRRYEIEHALRRTPIVALTAHAMDGDEARCIAAGMDDYLSKPLQSRRLCEVLATIALRSGRRASGPVDVSPTFAEVCSAGAMP
jgi:CheY-like chemotaxis protein